MPADRSPSSWARLAGILLILDGLAVLVLGSVVFLVFRPVAAIEGRPSADQTAWPILIATILVALLYFWAGQRGVRGIRRKRLVGMILAIPLGVLFGSVLLNDGASLPELAFAVAVVAVQVLIVVGLARWPAPEAERAQG